MHKIKLVGEIGINHNGDLNIAKKLIDICKLADIDYVKFQKRDIPSCYTKEELDKPRVSPWGKTNEEQKRGLEFESTEYNIIDQYCVDSNIKWFASPWDMKSVEFLRSYNMPYIKVASAMLTDLELLENIKSTNIPIILSTGMSTRNELNQALAYIGDKVEYILACTSTYPTRDDEMNLNFIKTLKSEYGSDYRIGFSNHSPGIMYLCCSAALGVEMIEFHITTDRSMYGSDQSASIETTGILKIGKHIRNIEKAMGTGEWIVFPSEEEIKNKLRKK